MWLLDGTQFIPILTRRRGMMYSRYNITTITATTTRTTIQGNRLASLPLQQQQHALFDSTLLASSANATRCRYLVRQQQQQRWYHHHHPGVNKFSILPAWIPQKRVLNHSDRSCSSSSQDPQRRFSIQSWFQTTTVGGSVMVVAGLWWLQQQQQYERSLDYESASVTLLEGDMTKNLTNKSQEQKPTSETDDFDLLHWWRQQRENNNNNKNNNNDDEGNSNGDNNQLDFDSFWNRIFEPAPHDHQQVSEEERQEQHRNWLDAIMTHISNTLGKSQQDQQQEQEKAADGLGNLTKQVLAALNLDSGKSDGKSSTSGGKEMIDSIVSEAHALFQQGEVKDSSNWSDIFRIVESYSTQLDAVAKQYVGDLDLSTMTPADLMYYLEYEDERKNPSSKRRAHRFCPGIDYDRVEQLNNYLDLAMISYADTAQAIQDGLRNHAAFPSELVFCSLTSQPGEPAHFVAVKKHQPKGWNAPLEVILGVRGTKSVADAVTDLLCETVDFQGGKGHAYIVTSGHYLVQKHSPLLEELRTKARKSKIKLYLVGHSLGAGAASIAGMEWHHNTHNNHIDVQVVGFGCPALVSKELAEASSSYITTVINDSDMVPRMSGISVANLLRGISQFDSSAYAKRDVHELLQELQRINPVLFNAQLANAADKFLAKLIDKYMMQNQPTVSADNNSSAGLAGSTTKTHKTTSTVMPSPNENETSDRSLTPVPTALPSPSSQQQQQQQLLPITPELYPPGKCIHFYRDGIGISGCIVPNTFFREIDVTRTMIDDHVFHTGYQQALLQVMRQHTGDHHFSFDKDAVE